MKNWKKWKFKIFWEFEDIFFFQNLKISKSQKFSFFFKNLKFSKSQKFENFRKSQNFKISKIWKNLKISKSQNFWKFSKKISKSKSQLFFFFFLPTFFFFFSNFENIFGPDFEEKLFWASLNIENVDFWVLAPLKWRFF